jgi:hypothetical protein
LGHAVDGTDYTAQVVITTNIMMLQEYEDDQWMFQQVRMPVCLP